MRWVTFRQDGGEDRAGLLVDGTVHALEPGVQLIDLLGDDGARLAAAGESARREPHEVLDLRAIELRAPIPRPPSIRDYSSFAEHIENGLRAIGKELGADYYVIPIFYFTNPGMVYGTGDTIRGPGDTKQLDFELEVAAVIGRPGLDLDPGEAEGVIAGYCIYNDWSARDLQRREQHTMPVGPGKGKDFAQTFGPCLVTPDELEPYRSGLSFDLSMRATVNGREYSRGNLSSIMWSFGEMVAHASRGVEIVTGHDERGRSVIVSDGPPVVVEEIAQGHARMAEIWATDATPVPLGPTEPEPTGKGPTVVPPQDNGHVIRYVEFDPGWRSPMHRTRSLDYGVMLRGEMVMELDDEEVVLRPGDVVVQRGADHLWENRGAEPALMLFVLVDASFTGELLGVLGEKAEHLMVEPAAE